MAGSDRAGAWQGHGGGGLHHGRGRPAESRTPCCQSQAPRPQMKLPIRTCFAPGVVPSGGMLVGASRGSHLGTPRHAACMLGRSALARVARPVVQIAFLCPHISMHTRVRLLCRQNNRVLPYTHSMAIKQRGEPAQGIDQVCGTNTPAKAQRKKLVRHPTPS